MPLQFTTIDSQELALPGTVPGRGPDAQSKDQSFSHFFATLVRYKWLFAAIVLGFTALVGILTFITPKSYTTTVRVMAGNPGTTSTNSTGADTALPILNALVLQGGVQTAETFAELIQGDNVAQRVLSNLKMTDDPQNVLQHLTVKPVVNTAILDVSVSWKNPEASARIANEFARVFTETQRGYVQAQANAAIGYLAAELPSAEVRMRKASAKLADFQSATGFVDAPNHTQQVVAQDAAVQEKIETVKMDLGVANAQLSNIPNPLLVDLKMRLAQVESQLSTARQQYTNEHPAVVALVQQRDLLRKQIAAQPAMVRNGNLIAPDAPSEAIAQTAAGYKARVEGDTADLAHLQAVHQSLQATIARLPRQAAELATLEQKSKLATDVYQALQQKYTDATIARTTAISNVTIVQPATADGAIVKPNLLLNLLVAPLIGVLLATIVLFILDYLERRIRDAEDVPGSIGLPVIATIPSFETTNRRALGWLQSMTVEAFLHLCVSLRLSRAGRLRSLAITSPAVGEGKSTVAYNLAKAMANVQPRILLIDGDLRRPRLHELAGLANNVGLADVLRGDLTLSDAVTEYSDELHLLTAGLNAENPIGLLTSYRFDDLIKEAEERYAMVIIDSPALSAVADGYSISSRVNGTALVVAANSTDERLAKQTVEKFRTLGINNLVGVVMNKTHERFNDYSNYFHDALTGAGTKGIA